MGNGKKLAGGPVSGIKPAPFSGLSGDKGDGSVSFSEEALRAILEEMIARRNAQLLGALTGKIHGQQPLPRLDAIHHRLGRVIDAGDAFLDALEMLALDDMAEEVGPVDEIESLRLQMAMDRLSKLMSTLSNILGKLSKTATDITKKLK